MTPGMVWYAVGMGIKTAGVRPGFGLVGGGGGGGGGVRAKIWIVNGGEV